MTFIDLTRKRLSAAKRAFTTRRVPAGDMATLVRGDLVPRTGDLVLASVQEIGKHRKIEQPNGRRALMMPGDEIIVCYGKGRNASNMRDNGVELADRACLLILAPLFDKECFPNWRYHRAGVVRKGRVQPADRWSRR